MNVEDYLPAIREEYPDISSSLEVWRGLLELRSKTFKAYASLEEAHGVVKPKISLSTPNGQDIMRILFFRVLEEASESVLATDLIHIKEELIDSFNYIVSAPLLDSSIFSEEKLTHQLHSAAKVSEHQVRQDGLTREDLGYFTLLICGHLADTFRNRAWMSTPQDLYFSGALEYYRILYLFTIKILTAFEDFADFFAFFIAKDQVLQFRLKSNY